MSMRESHWEDLFRAGPEERPEPEAWKLPSWLTDWEQWLTLAIMLLVVLSPAFSVQAARWVPGMPSLLVPSLAGLLTAMLLSRVRANELLLHPLGLAVGAAVILMQVLRFVGGGAPWSRARAFWDRMVAWVDVVRDGGISTDNLPFVLIVVSLAWLGAYLGGWAAFRWRNAWLAVIPSGVALLVNLSYQPGSFSLAFVVFSFGAIMLLMRAHLLDAMRRWRQAGADYPEFLSLLALNGTGWVAAGLLMLVLILPTAGAMTGFTSLWTNVRSPIEGWSVDWGLFTTVDAKKPVPVHRFEDIMPLQGSIKLNSREVATVTADGAPYPVFLRAALYEVYTGTGWKAGDRVEVPFEAAANGSQAAGYQGRYAVTATVDPEKGGGVVLGPGQPVALDRSATAEVVDGSRYPEISRVLPQDGGGSYVVTGTVSVASADELREAGTDYPAWVRQRYLQLPDGLPQRVRDRAFEWSRGRDNPYDIAKAIEAELRAYPVEYEVPVAPPGADAVDHFLFEERQGYFDYHASAMAVLLRARGIPARVAVGYRLEELDPSGAFYTVRERHAFTWVEVYFPDYGWVEFNPTTGTTAIDRDVAPGGPTEAVPPEGAFPPDVAPDFPQFPVEGEPVVFGPEEQPGTPWGRYALGTLAVAAVLGSVSGWVFWQTRTMGLPYPAQLWEKTVRLAAWAKVPQRADDTPAETARRIQAAFPGSREAGVLASAYARHRYGRKPLEEPERRELGRAWARLRNRLLARILRWR